MFTPPPPPQGQEATNLSEMLAALSDNDVQIIMDNDNNYDRINVYSLDGTCDEYSCKTATCGVHLCGDHKCGSFGCEEFDDPNEQTEPPENP